VRSGFERVVGGLLGIASGVALGWIVAEIAHQPWPIPVIALAAVGGFLGFLFGREMIETFYP
jgi:hypothetical protein